MFPCKETLFRPRSCKNPSCQASSYVLMTCQEMKCLHFSNSLPWTTSVVTISLRDIASWTDKTPKCTSADNRCGKCTYLMQVSRFKKTLLIPGGQLQVLHEQLEVLHEPAGRPQSSDPKPKKFLDKKRKQEGR